MASAERRKKPTNSLTQRSQRALRTSLPPLTSSAAEQGCHLKHILCSFSKMMLFLANIGIAALSPGRWGERSRDGGVGEGKKRGCNSAWKYYDGEILKEKASVRTKDALQYRPCTGVWES